MNDNSKQYFGEMIKNRNLPIVTQQKTLYVLKRGTNQLASEWQGKQETY